MTFLLILFCFCFLAWSLRGQILKWLLRKSFNQYARQAENRHAAWRHSSNERKGGWSNPLKRRKKIDPTIGEYVRFTETDETTATNSGSTAGTEIRNETQITDVEWEEIS